VLRVGGNVVHAEQHIDREAGVFFQRVEFDLGETLRGDEIAPAFAPIARRSTCGTAALLRRAAPDRRPRLPRTTLPE